MVDNNLTYILKSIWPMLVIFIVVIVTIRVVYLLSHKEKIVFYKEIMLLFFIVYLYLLFQLVTNRDISNGGVNLIPFKEIFRYEITSRQFLLNVIGNILVFIPFGYFVTLYTKTKKIFTILIVTLITSLTIEFVQLQIGRAFDVDDVILNVIGGIAGYLIFIGLVSIKNHLPKIFQKNWFYNLLCLILLIAGIIYILDIVDINFRWF